MSEKEDLNFIKMHFDFWDKLSSSEVDLMINNIRGVSYLKGFNLHSADNECLGVLLVRSGSLRVYILSEDGREVTLYRLSSGEICVLSASCILKNITFDVNIDAESNTDAFLLNIDTFGRLCKQNIYVENFAYRNTLEKFSDVMWAIEQILFMRFDKRLAIFLLDEMAKSNNPDLNFTHEQIAKYIGSAREVVSRMLKVFQEQGILEQSRGLIHIIDKDQLKELL